MVPIVHETPGRYDVIIRVARDGGQLPDPVTFAVAADQAASRRSASIISVHMADTIINVVTVTAPGRYAATAVARAVVSDALKLQAPSSIQLKALISSIQLKALIGDVRWADVAACGGIRGYVPCAGRSPAHGEEW
jgi:hypothetical protein